MAESYRGLTIRIGADTTKLSASLRAANGAITATSNQARRLKEALRLDPGNTGAMAKSVTVIGQQATAAATKLANLKQGFENVSAQTAKSVQNQGKTFGQLVQQTGNAALEVENLKTSYGGLEKQLATTYTQLSKISASVGTGKKFKVTDGDTTDLEKIQREYDEIIKKRDQLRASSSRTEADDKMLAKLEKQVPLYGELLEKVRPLKTAFNEVSAAYDDARTVAQLKDTQVEIERTTAQVKAFASAMDQVQTKSSIAQGLGGNFDEKLRNLATTAESAGARAEYLKSAFNISPSGITSVFDRMKALREQSTATKAQAELLGDALKKYRAAGIDKVAAQTKNAAQRARDAEDAYNDSVTTIKTLKAEIGNLSNQQKDMARQGKQGTEEYERLGTALQDAGARLREAYSASSGLQENLDVSRAVVEFKELESAAAKVNGELKEVNGFSGLKEAGASAYMLAEQVGQYAQQGLSEVVDATTTLDSAYADMRKTVDGTEEQFRELYNAAVTASRQQPVTAATILQIEALGGQLGFNVTQLEEFSRVVSGLDIATNMNWEDAGTSMAQFFNIFDTNKELVSNYGSALVDLGNHFATTESDISMMAARIASAGTSIGMSEADVLGLSTALSSMGVKAEAGGSSISTIMTNIDKSVALATDGIAKYASDFGMSVSEYVTMLSSLDEDALGDIAANYSMSARDFKAATVDAVSSLEEWSKTAGYKTAQEFADAWEGDPIEALTNVFKGLDQAADSGGNLALMLDDLGISSIRQLDISRRLASNPTLLADAIRTANDAWRENTALDTEVEKRNESLSARFETLKNNITAVKTELGEGLSPLIDWASQQMQAVADILESLPDSAKTGILSVMSGLAGLVTVSPIISGIANNIGGLTEGLVKFIASATINPTSLGIVAAVTALYAAYKGFIQPALEAKRVQDDFNSALKLTRETAENLDKSMSIGSSALENLSSKFERAMTIEELTEDLNDFNEAVNSITSPVDKSNVLLGQYKTVIDDLAGRGHASAEDLAKLQWAVKGLNDEFGTTYTAEDVLRGKYENERGAIVSLRDEIDRLIEKRQEQARVEAAQNLYTASLQKQAEYGMNLDLAKQDIEEFDRMVDERVASFERLDNGVHTHEQLVDAATRSVSQELGVTREALEQDAEAAQKALDEVDREVAYSEDLMTNYTRESLKGAEAIREFVDGAFSWTDLGWAEALGRNGINDLNEFAKALDDAGISVKDLQAIYDDTSVKFADMVDASGGEMDKLIDTLMTYRDEHLGEIRTEFDDSGAMAKARESIDDVRETLAENPIKIGADSSEVSQGAAKANADIDSVKQDAPAEIEADASPAEEGAEDAQAAINGVHQESPVTIQATSDIQGPQDVSYTANMDTSSALSQLQGLSSVIDNVPRKIGVTATAYTSAATPLIYELKSAVDSVPSYHTTTFTADASGVYGVIASARTAISNFVSSAQVSISGVGNASGGIRYHADGMIVDRPSWLGTRDIVGEAGAEAIIPLTNKKYVQPFADTVADGMLSKIGGMGGVTNNYTINGLTVAPDSALAKAMDATFEEARRLSRMGRR